MRSTSAASPWYSAVPPLLLSKLVIAAALLLVAVVFLPLSVVPPSNLLSTGTRTHPGPRSPSPSMSQTQTPSLTLSPSASPSQSQAPSASRSPTPSVTSATSQSSSLSALPTQPVTAMTAGSCSKVIPGPEAAVYWSGAWPAGIIAPPKPLATGTGVDAYFLSEICAGVAGHEVAFDFALAGVRELVEAGSGDFSLPGALCRGGVCAGVLRVTRLQNCPYPLFPPPLRNASDDLDLLADAYLMGPDYIEAIFDGPEFHTAMGVHVGNCTYEIPFAATVPGVYHVEATLVRSNWKGLDEVAPTRALTLTNLIGTRYIRIGDVIPPATSDSLRLAVLYGRSADAAPPAGIALPTRIPPLPACSLSSAPHAVSTSHPGRWIRLAPVKGMFDAGFAPKHNFSDMFAKYQYNYSGFFTFTPPVFSDRETGIAWQPYTCRRSAAAANVASVAQCINQHKPIAFLGDSQVRTLFNAVMARFAGQTDVALKRATGNQCAGSPVTNSVCFAHDPFLTNPNPLESLPLTRSLVVNIGQWMVVHMDTPLAEYAAHLASTVFSVNSEAWVADAARAQKSDRIRIVWLETVPQPIYYLLKCASDFSKFWLQCRASPVRLRLSPSTSDESSKDYRTSQRVHIANRIARRLFTSRGWANVSADRSPATLHIIDQENLLLGLTSHYGDLAHPVNLDNALLVSTDNIVEVFCPELQEGLS